MPPRLEIVKHRLHLGTESRPLRAFSTARPARRQLEHILFIRIAITAHQHWAYRQQIPRAILLEHQILSRGIHEALNCGSCLSTPRRPDDEGERVRRTLRHGAL